MPDTLALLGVLGFAAGVALGSIFSFSWPSLAFLLCVSGIFGIAWLLRPRTIYLCVLVVILAVAIGVVRVESEPRTLPASLSSLVGSEVTLTGTVAGDPDLRESSQRVPVKISINGESTTVLVVTDRYTRFSYGDLVNVHGRLKQPEPFDTDGGRTFRYDMFLAKDGIYALVQPAEVHVVGISSSPYDRVFRAFYAVKHGFTHAIEGALPEPHASLAAGLLTGGKQGLGQTLLDAFIIAGLLPIVVLSGYNVMIIAEAVLRGLSFLPKRTALIVAVSTVTLFVLAAGAGSSALRALFMALLALFARATGRLYEALRGLMAALVLMLLWSPLQLVYDPGFQFSFMATLGLIIAAPFFAHYLQRVTHKGVRELLASTLAAQVFVLPLLLYQTGNLSLVAIPANILVLPVIPIAMAASAIGAAVAGVIPTLGPIAGIPAYVLLAYIIETARLFASLPLAQVLVPAFPLALVLVMYGFIGWWMWRARKTAPIDSGAVLMLSSVKLSR